MITHYDRVLEIAKQITKDTAYEPMSFASSLQIAAQIHLSEIIQCLIDQKVKQHVIDMLSGDIKD